MFLEWESNSGKLQFISGKFQNNAINDVKQILFNHVIKEINRFISKGTHVTLFEIFNGCYLVRLKK